MVLLIFVNKGNLRVEKYPAIVYTTNVVGFNIIREKTSRLNNVLFL